MYLRNWADQNSHVWSYRLLVPRANFPKWTREAIGSVAFQRDLYTTISGDREDDSFERWIEADFETPAKESLSKVLQEKKLTLKDWNRLALFLAAQDVRTPTNYIETTERWVKSLPEIIEKVLQNTVRSLEEHYRDGKPLPHLDPDTELQSIKDIFKVTITHNAVPEQNLGEIRAEVIAGRKSWIQSQRHLLTNTAKVLLKHKWSIVRPAPGMSWFTSDHPVLRLNYYKDGKYDLKGGWGRDGGNLIMPLSSQHLLFTEIGTELPDYCTMPEDKTYMIQRFLAERAFRWIFAHKVLPYVERIRPRIIDLEQFAYEKQKWKDWHREQSDFEK